MSRAVHKARHPVLVLGDQLDARSAAFDGLDRAADVVWMAEMRPGRQFYYTHEDFERHAEGRKDLRNAQFSREMRRKLGVLMEGGKPVGGEWNYESENRLSFGKAGPDPVPGLKSFRPDHIMREVIALDDFIEHRLDLFGPYEDAMWTGLPYVYHSRLSSAINRHLLDPRDAVAAAEAAGRRN